MVPWSLIFFVVRLSTWSLGSSWNLLTVQHEPQLLVFPYFKHIQHFVHDDSLCSVTLFLSTANCQNSLATNPLISSKQCWLHIWKYNSATTNHKKWKSYWILLKFNWEKSFFFPDHTVQYISIYSTKYINFPTAVPVQKSVSIITACGQYICFFC